MARCVNFQWDQIRTFKTSQEEDERQDGEQLLTCSPFQAVPKRKARATLLGLLPSPGHSPVLHLWPLAAFIEVPWTARRMGQWSGKRALVLPLPLPDWVTLDKSLYSSGPSSGIGVPIPTLLRPGRPWPVHSIKYQRK